MTRLSKGQKAPAGTAETYCAILRTSTRNNARDQHQQPLQGQPFQSDLQLTGHAARVKMCPLQAMHNRLKEHGALQT